MIILGSRTRPEIGSNMKFLCEHISQNTKIKQSYMMAYINNTSLVIKHMNCDEQCFKNDIYMNVLMNNAAELRQLSYYAYGAVFCDKFAAIFYEFPQNTQTLELLFKEFKRQNFENKSYEIYLDIVFKELNKLHMRNLYHGNPSPDYIFIVGKFANFMDFKFRKQYLQVYDFILFLINMKQLTKEFNKDINNFLFKLVLKYIKEYRNSDILCNIVSCILENNEPIFTKIRTIEKISNYWFEHGSINPLWIDDKTKLSKFTAHYFNLQLDNSIITLIEDFQMKKLEPPQYENIPIEIPSKINTREPDVISLTSCKYYRSGNYAIENNNYAIENRNIIKNCLNLSGNIYIPQILSTTKKPIVKYISHSNMIDDAFKIPNSTLNIYGDYRYPGGKYYASTKNEPMPPTQEEQIFIRTDISRLVENSKYICDRKFYGCNINSAHGDHKTYPYLWNGLIIKSDYNVSYKFQKESLIMMMDNVHILRDKDGRLYDSVHPENKIKCAYAVAPLVDIWDLRNMDEIFEQYRKTIHNLFHSSNGGVLLTGGLGMGFYITKNINISNINELKERIFHRISVKSLRDEVMKLRSDQAKINTIVTFIKNKYKEIIKSELANSTYDEIHVYI